MRILCIYHSRDLDGWCSAAIVKYYFSTDASVDLVLFGWEYGDPIPEKEIEESASVIMCDISFPADKMFEIHQSGKDFTWIDHHKSSIKAVQLEGDLPCDISRELGGIKDELGIHTYAGVRNTEYAACELTWKYFFIENMPNFVWWLGMYDSFRHKGTKYESDTLKFQYAARARWKKPEDFDYVFSLYDHKLIFDDRKMVREGKIIYKYLCTEAEQIYSNAFPITIKGHKFAIVNRERFNPINFGINYHKDGYEGFACFWFNGKKWAWSLYNDDSSVDVSKIASYYGGGGHKGAAGFIQAVLNLMI